MTRGGERIAPQGLGRILMVPALLALATFAGLALGLTVDGWRDALAVLLVALPLASFARHWLRRSSHPDRTHQPKDA